MKKTRQKNYFLIATGVLVGVFIIWNLIWLGFRVLIYAPYVKDIPLYYGSHLSTEGNFDFYVSKPGYLAFDWNLCVDDENDNGIIIWPHLSSNPTYAITLNTSKIKTRTSLVSYNVDKNGTLIDENRTEEELRIFEENEDAIKKLFEAANNKWNL